MITKISKNSLLIFSCVSTISFGQLKVLNNGNVGIGVANPITKFEVNNGSPSVYSINPNGGGVDLTNGGDLAQNYNGYYSLNSGFITGSKLKFRITPNGNVAIGGEPVPAYRLVISNKNNSAITNSFSINPNSNGVDLYSSSDLRLYTTGIVDQYYQNEYSFFQGTSSSNNLRMKINANGNIGIGTGIGTSNSSYLLSLGSGLNFKKLAVYNDFFGSDFYGFGVTSCSFDFWIGSNCAQYRFRDANGAVGVAITSIGGDCCRIHPPVIYLFPKC